MTQQQAIEALHALPRTAPGGASLARMQALLQALGNPEQALKAIHIAGTNGKGTLAALTASILTAAGYKTGLTISPYVLDFRERFQINGEMIPPRTLSALAEKVLAAAAKIRAAGGEGPVEFEAVTAIAFLWFAREKCDLVVLETGIGGRFDATNTVPGTLVAAITQIGLDHTELLGDTLEKIATEKAGIIKEGCQVVCYPEQPEEAMGPILAAVAERHATLILPDLADLQRRKCRPLENLIDYGGYTVSLPFPGKHQANHAAMAVEIALALWRAHHYDIPDEAILAGLQNARLPARIEVLRRHPLLLLDGCHNPDGVQALAATLAEAGYAGNLVGVLGMLADKNCEEMLSDLEPCFDKVYTVTPACPRALAGAELQKLARFHFEAEAADTLAQALRAATAYADEKNLAGVVVCGSLYLAAEARPLLIKEAEK
ncbi:MAG: bifunctional folylpolyglutamate synthase/dihydrofolate synthase [Gemmiger sp.]|nr:bifunctional folylpolyglutamate synthase/dihydrofolate synthase [Gemmiger sp.]